MDTMSSRRLIDEQPGTRTKPMRVLCLGMPRTGTMSIHSALQMLEYTPYHMIDAVKGGRLDLWTEGLRAKYYREGKEWGRDELDKLIGHYDSILDAPGIAFIEELVAAYPNAKVVLNDREMNSWLRSMEDGPARVLRWNWSLVASWDPSFARPFLNLMRVVGPNVYGMMPPDIEFISDASPASHRYRAHCETVRRLVPEENLLVYRLQEGWQPLCNFLGVDVPEEEFPRVNDTKSFIWGSQILFGRALAKMVLKVSAMIAVPIAGAGAAFWWRGSFQV